MHLGFMEHYDIYYGLRAKLLALLNF